MSSVWPVLAVWKRILLVIWAFFCGIAALFWLPLWGIFIFLVVFFLGLVNTPAAILGWKSGSIWDRNFGKWVPVHPGIVSQTKDPSAESLVAGAGPAAGLGARASDEMPPHPDPAWAWPQPAAGTDEAWEKQMLRQLGMEEAEGVTEEELMHRMYR